MTHDLARVLRCPWESAESVKCQNGAAFASDDHGSETVDIQAFGTQTRKEVPLRHVCEILQARAEEILEMVALELKRAGYYDRIAAGLVLTGGASLLRGFPEIAEAKLGIPARLGVPRGFSGLSDLIGSPSYATSVGLVQYALTDHQAAAEPSSLGFELPAGGLLRRLASLGRALMPQ